MEPIPQVCVGAIAVVDDKLLMIRRGHGPSGGQWSIPGGRVEAGETVPVAVVRELYEETGLEGVCEHLVGWVERLDEGYHFVILDFAVTLWEDDPALLVPTPGDDAVEAAWIPVHDVAELDLADGLAEFLHEHEIIPTIV